MSGEERLRWMEAYEATGKRGLRSARGSMFRVRRLRKWWRRYQEAGAEGLKDSSRKPASSPNQKVFAREEAADPGAEEDRESRRSPPEVGTAPPPRDRAFGGDNPESAEARGRTDEGRPRRDSRRAAVFAPGEGSAPVRARRALSWARLGRRRGERHRVADRQPALPAGAEAERGQSRREPRRRADAHSGGAAAPWLRGDCQFAAQPWRVRRGPLARRSAAGLCGAPADRSRDRQRCLPSLHRARHPHAPGPCRAASRGAGVGRPRPVRPADQPSFIRSWLRSGKIGSSRPSSSNWRPKPRLRFSFTTGSRRPARSRNMRR